MEVKTFAPAALVTAAFFFAHYFIDLPAITKARKAGKIPFPRTTGTPEMDRAFRVQANQLEQLPGFLSGLYAFSAFVSPTIAGYLGTGWVVLRMLYGMQYRRSANFKYLLPYTIPAYVIVLGLHGTVAYTALKMLL